jgi:hypothetical protein
LIIQVITENLRFLVILKWLNICQKNVIEEFIKESTDNHKKISLTSNEKSMDKSIAHKLGFKHILCIFNGKLIQNPIPI